MSGRVTMYAIVVLCLRPCSWGSVCVSRAAATIVLEFEGETIACCSSKQNYYFIPHKHTHMAVTMVSVSSGGGGPRRNPPLASGLRLATAPPQPAPCFRASALCSRGGGPPYMRASALAMAAARRGSTSP